MPRQPLSGRRILVTAGPTWVRIDAVRHLGNLSSGRTGLTIARSLSAAGAAVHLLMGPGRALPSTEDRAAITVQDFVTFDELHAAVRELVGSRRFDAMVHTAAVSDFRPVSEERGKLPSGMEELVLRLRPTPKIVDEVKALDPKILLVKFKLESGKTEAELLEIAQRSRERSHAELIVANDLAMMGPGRHPAWILDAAGVKVRAETAEELAEELTGEIAAALRAH